MMKNKKVKKAAIINCFACLSIPISFGAGIYIFNNDFAPRDVCDHDETSGSHNDLLTSSSSISLVSYFQNLWEYSAMNAHGSCGYVSLAQCLTYFDTFLNDSIVAESYEHKNTSSLTVSEAVSHSPGVLRATYPSNSVDLYFHAQTSYLTDYQMKLMLTLNNYYGRTPNTFSYAVGMWDYQHILDSVCSDLAFVNAYSIPSGVNPASTSIQIMVRQLVVAYLQSHSPVILHIADGVDGNGNYTNYHSVVAYYSDDSGIHCNFGWGSSSCDVVLDDELIANAGYFDVSDIEHVHSNNYIIDGVAYCGCGEQYS